MQEHTAFHYKDLLEYVTNDKLISLEKQTQEIKKNAKRTSQ